MGYARGDRVHLRGLGTGVVIEPRGAGRYAIEMKGRVVLALNRDLEPAEEPRRRNMSPAKPAGSPHGVAAAGPTPSLDLHGMTAADAIALVEQLINDALLAGHGEVRIIHGKSGGRVKGAVHRYLRQMPSVASFRVDPRNTGVTVVSFA
jgi:DNA mismatch repair protein MutS2